MVGNCQTNQEQLEPREVTGLPEDTLVLRAIVDRAQ